MSETAELGGHGSGHGASSFSAGREARVTREVPGSVPGRCWSPSSTLGFLLYKRPVNACWLPRCLVGWAPIAINVSGAFALVPETLLGLRSAWIVLG